MESLSLTQSYALLALRREKKRRASFCGSQPCACILLGAVFELLRNKRLQKAADGKLSAAGEAPCAPYLQAVLDHVIKEPGRLEELLGDYTDPDPKGPMQTLLDLVIESLAGASALTTQRERGFLSDRVVYHADAVNSGALLEKLRRELILDAKPTEESLSLLYLLLLGGQLDGLLEESECAQLENRWPKWLEEEPWAFLRQLVDSLNEAMVQVYGCTFSLSPVGQR